MVTALPPCVIQRQD
jgi:gyrA: DNA gyrase, A subunit